MMTHEELLAWAKKRALEYLDAGDIANAVASMGSDMDNPESIENRQKMIDGMCLILTGDSRRVRDWIENWR